MAPADFDTVILAGGRASRMHGMDKPALAVGGRAMLVSVAQAAVSAGTSRLILVGPQRSGGLQSALVELCAGLPGGLITVRESPPDGGPVPALRRGLSAVTAPWIALLAADLPFLTGSWLAELLALAANEDGAVLADDTGRAQWLAGCWRSARLRSAVAGYAGTSLAGLMTPLSPALLRPAMHAGARGAARPPWLDCDDPAKLAEARAAAARTE